MKQVLDTFPLIGLLLATILGALVQSILGWQDSQQKFDFSRYWPSMIRAVISGIIIFIGAYSGFVGEANIFTYLIAFLTGMGVDAAGNRLAGIIRKDNKTPDTQNPPP